MSESTLSRRISEFVGVALFALALIWLIALVTHEPTDPVWFFTTGASQAPANFAGRVGAFLSELSFQLFGYVSYLLPLVIGVIGWHYFWCKPPEAAYTKLAGATLFFGCACAFLSLLFGTAEIAGKTFHAGGSLGTWLDAAFSDYLNRTGSIIVLLTLMALSVILSTQFSFGRLFARASEESRDLSARGMGWARMWIEQRRKERERRGVAARHARPEPGTRDSGSGMNRPSAATRPSIPDPGNRMPDPRIPVLARKPAASTPPAQEPPPKPVRAATGCVHASSRLAARRAEGRAEDRRAGADGGRASARGQVSRVLRGGAGRADPSRPGRHHLRIQAGSGRQVQQDHGSCRRPVPRDAGRVGADRSHPGQVDGRHPDPEPESRDHLAPRAARIRRLHAVRYQS